MAPPRTVAKRRINVGIPVDSYKRFKKISRKHGQCTPTEYLRKIIEDVLAQHADELLVGGSINEFRKDYFKPS